MKCPHCNYEYGWSNETMSVIKGVHDDFYSLDLDLSRQTNLYPYKETKTLYGCPACNKVFTQ